MDSLILSLESVSKKFCRDLKRSLWYGVKDLASEIFLTRDGKGQLRQDEFWALKDVSVDVRRGETLGLIGFNGAGKSTLLKLINGLIKPDSGRITVRGQVGALIELGTGFNSILTGRENIYVNAAILGLSRKEVERRLDEIIDFAEIGDFIDAPVQSYSSGMTVRLAFSIAAHLNPHLLLMDEILSVGDASFRQRCLDRLNNYKKSGGTVLFVSHNSSVVEAISDRVMFLDHGAVAEIGQPAEVVRNYEGRALQRSREADLRLGDNPESLDSQAIWITSVKCYDLAGIQKTELDFGEPFEIRLQYELNKDIHFPYLVIAIKKRDCEKPAVSIVSMMWDGVHVETIPRRGVIGCIIQNPSFSPGPYRIEVGVQALASMQLGAKWYMPSTELGSVTILPGSLKCRFLGLPAPYLFSHPALVIVEHSWSLNGNRL